MDPATTTLSQDLEARVDNLQERITGGLNDIQRQQTLIDSLVEANDRVMSLTTGRERFHQVYSKITALESFISQVDPFHDPRVDEEILLLEEPRIRHEARILDEIKKHEKSLDSTALHNFDHLIPKLEEVRRKTLLQLEEAEKINKETQQLIGVYNQMMTSMKDILYQWEKKLKAKEQERLVKKK